jgi:hypothetical protein
MWMMCVIPPVVQDCGDSLPPPVMNEPDLTLSGKPYIMSFERTDHGDNEDNGSRMSKVTIPVSVVGMDLELWEGFDLIGCGYTRLSLRL